MSLVRFRVWAPGVPASPTEKPFPFRVSCVSLVEIAEIYAITLRAAYARLQRRGLRRRSRLGSHAPWMLTRRAEIWRLISYGCSLQDMARQFRIRPYSLLRWMHRWIPGTYARMKRRRPYSTRNVISTEHLCELVTQGGTLKDLARQLGIKERSAYDMVRRRARDLLRVAVANERRISCDDEIWPRR